MIDQHTVQVVIGIVTVKDEAQLDVVITVGVIRETVSYGLVRVGTTSAIVVADGAVVVIVVDGDIIATPVVGGDP